MSHLNLTPDMLRWYFPVYGITVHKKVIVIHRHCRMQTPPKGKRGNRKSIIAINRKSLDLLLYKVLSCNINFLSLMCLTYGQNFPVNGRKVKSDINVFLTYAKRSFGQFSYFWFLEFQRRSAPHIHLATTLPPPDDCRRELFATIWSDIVEQGNWPYTAIESPYMRKNAAFGMNTKDSVFRQHRRAKNWKEIYNEDGAIRYVLKYAKKQYQKAVPKDFRDVGRFWGTSRDVSPPKQIEVPMTEDEVRLLLTSLGRDFSEWGALPKYIFHS